MTSRYTAGAGGSGDGVLEVSIAGGATAGTSTVARPIGTNRLMTQDKYLVGRSAKYSTVRAYLTSPRVLARLSAGATDDPIKLPLATIWYSEGTVSRIAAIA